MKRDVAGWTRVCHDCQQSKIHRHVKAPLQSFASPNARFESINVDIVGPLPPFQGCAYLFTCVDRYTRLPEAMSMTNTTADSCAVALLSGWISGFGLPVTITSEQERQFESDLWTALMNLLEVTRNRTTAYYLKANGLRARFVGNNWIHSFFLVSVQPSRRICLALQPS